MARLFTNIIAFPSRLRRAVRRHGVFGLFTVATGQASGLASRLRPSVRADILQGQQRARDFDKRFGVDTAGYIHPTELTINSPNQVHAVSYGASDPRDFKNAIESLQMDHGNFVFVDFGSGKGRAIVLASEFPFKQIVGVEFSEELHKIAQDNISRLSRNGCHCPNVESICMDVVDYPLPDDDLVCYFCNPFDATLMTQVVGNIRKSLLRKPRDIFILYYNAKEAHLFDEAGCFEKVATDGWIRIWRTAPDSQRKKEGFSC